MSRSAPLSVLVLSFAIGCAGSGSDAPVPHDGSGGSAASTAGNGGTSAGTSGSASGSGHGGGAGKPAGTAGGAGKGGLPNGGAGGGSGGGKSGASGAGAKGGAAGKAGGAGGGGDATGGAGGTTPAPPPPTFAHAQGDKLVDGAGKPLLLRGVSLGNWLVNEGYMWKLDGPNGDRGRRMEQRFSELVGPDKAKAFWKAWRDTFVTEADVARIAALGFNSIRLPLNARLLMPDGQTAFDEEGFASVKKVVDWSHQHGLFVVLDMHAAPGGQTGTNIDDDANDKPELFSDPSHRDRLVTLWKEIAHRYANEPAVLGYDLLNEPIAPAFSSNNGALWPIYQKIGAAIRAVDTHHVLVVEGAQWANNWATLDAPFDENLVYSFHKYWDATDTASIQGYLDRQAQWKKPIWVGETGENDDGWYKAVIPMLESHAIGWAFWTWKKMDSGNNPYSVVPPAKWGVVQQYVTDMSQKPSAADAQDALDGLIANVALAKCNYNQSVVCSLLACP